MNLTIPWYCLVTHFEIRDPSGGLLQEWDRERDLYNTMMEEASMVNMLHQVTTLNKKRHSDEYKNSNTCLRCDEYAPVDSLYCVNHKYCSTCRKDLDEQDFRGYAWNKCFDCEECCTCEECDTCNKHVNDCDCEEKPPF